MKEQFLPYNLALRLKELGFNEECFGYYVDGELDLEWRFIDTTQFGHCESVLAPLWQQAFDWFREKHYIDSAILPTCSIKYLYRLYEQKSKSKTQIYGEYMGKEYKTYEKARKACLEKLIELCEKK